MPAPAPSHLELTRRGWALLGATLGLLVAGRLLGTLELTVLGVATLALLGYAALSVRQVPSVHISREVHPARVHVDGEARVDLLARGAGGVRPFAVTDRFDDGERVARFLLPPLEPGRTALAAYRLPTERRGRFHLGPAAVTVTDPFGLARRAQRDDAVDEVVVLPRVHALRPLPGHPARRGLATAPATRFHAPSPSGEELLGLREYEVGDDLRRIHWRSTARIGDLVVREDELATEPRATVVLDLRPAVHDTESLEAAIEAAASVTVRLARSGIPFTLVTTAGRTLAQSGPRGRGAIAAESAALEALAVTAADGITTPLAVLNRLAGRTGTVVAIVGTLTPQERSALLGAGRVDAPLVLVATREGEAAGRSASVSVVDGRRGQLVASWDTAMARRRTRSGVR